MANLYLTLEPGPFSIGQTLVLTGDEAHHAARVGRVTVGEKTVVGDGQGHTASVVVESVTNREIHATVTDAQVHAVQEPRVWLAQALAKGDRDELAIQTATELGVFGVIPLIARRSVVHWRGDKVVSGVDRWRKIVTQASKQSLRAFIPEVLPPCEVRDLPTQIPGARIIALDPDAETALSALDVDDHTALVLVVGPEGGIDDEELQQVLTADGAHARLGSTVLRTSSAGPAALAVLNVKLGRW